MGMLDGLLGGIVGAEMATAVNSFIQQHGGVQGVVAQLCQWGGKVVDELKGREEHVIFALPKTLRAVARRVDSLSSDSSAG